MENAYPGKMHINQVQHKLRNLLEEGKNKNIGKKKWCFSSNLSEYEDRTKKLDSPKKKICQNHARRCSVYSHIRPLALLQQR